MGAKTDEIKTANIAIVILAVNFTDVAVTIGSHENVQLLPYSIHCFRSGTELNSMELVFLEFMSLGLDLVQLLGWGK